MGKGRASELCLHSQRSKNLLGDPGRGSHYIHAAAPTAKLAKGATITDFLWDSEHFFCGDEFLKV